MKTVLAKRLHMSRRDLDLNQDYVASKAGVSRAYISDLERGKTDNPSVRDIAAIAAVLGVRPEYLLGWTDDPLGESRSPSLAENRIVYQVDTPDEYRQVQEILDLFHEFDPETRALAIQVMRTFRRSRDGRIIG